MYIGREIARIELFATCGQQLMKVTVTQSAQPTRRTEATAPRRHYPMWAMLLVAVVVMLGAALLGAPPWQSFSPAAEQ